MYPLIIVCLVDTSSNHTHNSILDSALRIVLHGGPSISSSTPSNSQYPEELRVAPFTVISLPLPDSSITLVTVVVVGPELGVTSAVDVLGNSLPDPHMMRTAPEAPLPPVV